MIRETILPVHPGEILLEEFMKPLDISQNELARALRVPPRRINEIVHGKRGITVDTALRLSRHFGTSVRFWLGLQDDYDLDIAEDSQVVARINREVTPRAVAIK
jgi:antitoxin HigA-1